MGLPHSPQNFSGRSNSALQDGQTYFADPRGQLIGEAASDTADDVVVRDLDMARLQEVRDQYGIPVVAVVNLADLMQHVSRLGRKDDLARMQAYREQYGLED